jgi:hypothetical protein
MIGYKSTIINDNPVSFWTFDYDKQATSTTIIDEIGNKNPLTIIGDNYNLERVSINDIEVGQNNHSCFIAELEKLNGVWSPAYFTASHSTDFDFTDSFSIEFLFYKNPPNIIRESTEPGRNNNIISPLIFKNGLITLYAVDYYGTYNTNSEAIIVNLFENSQNELNLSVGDGDSNRSILEEVLHVVVTYEWFEYDYGVWHSIARLYVNGQKFSEDLKVYNYIPAVFGTYGEWRIAANGGSDPVTDFQTELLKIDQISVFNYKLTDEQISRHYKKTKRYGNLIIDDIPTYYWRFDEGNISGNEVYPLVGGITGTIASKYTRYQAGPSRIIDSKSLYLYDGGSVYFENLDYRGGYIEFLDISKDYSVEFWFKTTWKKRGVLFSCVEEKPEFKGISIYINSNNGEEYPNSIEILEGFNTNMVYSGGFYTDNVWHHLTLSKSGNILKLYIDGAEVANKYIDIQQSNGKPSQIHVMNDRPGNVGVDGYISELAIYDYSLQDTQVNSRWNFSTRYKVFGYTLLEGQGTKAIVRFYDSLSGGLLGEVESNALGEYSYYPYTNRQLDVIAKIPNNNTTRYRIHGPIVPAEYPDDHLTP